MLHYRLMPRRILLAESSRPVVTAIRKDLEGTGFALDAVAPRDAAARFDPREHVAALVRGDGHAAPVMEALRAADPLLPLVVVFFDEEEAALHPDAFGADGVLVGPLTAPAVAGACRMAERLRAEALRAAELELALARRAQGEAGLDFLKKLLLLEVKRSKRYGYPVSLALVAVDRWDDLRAQLGARGAAALLGELLGVMSTTLRDIDLAAPFADERFVILMPHTRGEGGLQVGRRLCAKVREHAGPVRVTISVGVAGHEGGGTVAFGGLVKRAAEALTRARAAGGDRAEPADPPPKRDRISLG